MNTSLLVIVVLLVVLLVALFMRKKKGTPTHTEQKSQVEENQPNQETDFGPEDLQNKE